MSIEFKDIADLQIKLNQLKAIQMGHRAALEDYLGQFGIYLPANKSKHVVLDVANLPEGFELDKISEISNPYHTMMELVGVKINKDEIY